MFDFQKLDVYQKSKNFCKEIGNGVGIHWESIDEDISVAALL